MFAAASALFWSVELPLKVLMSLQRWSPKEGTTRSYWHDEISQGELEVLVVLQTRWVFPHAVVVKRRTSGGWIFSPSHGTPNIPLQVASVTKQHVPFFRSSGGITYSNHLFLRSHQYISNCWKYFFLLFSLFFTFLQKSKKRKVIYLLNYFF